ncbi:hypothetical protein DUNSADRAFT_7594 [Dunaliella salina]|uniref:Uncharacterized protein n=1 Tax=Dunaliella salina TaxID=3046 RepID=A0ABQ7GL25_DUNSA|nr:hypothetical protein DUNSADRAFT_7594 [Dunaliella salina]|eukprot:KAF5835314.1 hypothetical protein DUNSADRAFT_7594 [Dunaliella salina]
MPAMLRKRWGQIIGYNARKSVYGPQDELVSVLYIWRIAVAIIAAVACGTMPATGWAPPAVFFLASMLSTVVFYKGYLQIDEDEYGGKAPLLWDGTPLSMCTFLVAWIVTYSAAHF